VTEGMLLYQCGNICREGLSDFFREFFDDLTIECFNIPDSTQVKKNEMYVVLEYQEKIYVYV
jgi:hypothetical protein